ncbi:Protein BOLA4 chloroplastic/mitochondrial [Euphorbia peplus]|nr:Protein BOLA4 chloroplastic/mitochondrial [Euphorbia peplus]
MAKSLMLRPYILSGHRLLHHHHATSSSSLLQLPHRQFLSQKSALSMKPQANILFSTDCGCHRLSKLGFGCRRFSVRATNVNDAGSIDSPLMLSMEKKIKEHLNAESVSVKDAYGDGRHVSIDVISSSFEGQSAVNRQRMVYKAIWEELQSTVHAVDQMTTKTPAEGEPKK